MAVGRVHQSRVGLNARPDLGEGPLARTVALAVPRARNTKLTISLRKSLGLAMPAGFSIFSSSVEVRAGCAVGFNNALG